MNRVVDQASARRVSWRFVLLYACACTGTWIALLTPVLITISLKIRQLTPDDATANHSLVLSVGAFFALASNPLFGRLSDPHCRASACAARGSSAACSAARSRCCSSHKRNQTRRC